LVSRNRTHQRNPSKALRAWAGLQCAVHDADQQKFLVAKQLKKLDELFHDTLNDIYFAEKKIFATLPKMAKAAQSPDLKTAFEKHRVETAGSSARRCL
jgi:hypothetical protein